MGKFIFRSAWIIRYRFFFYEYRIGSDISEDDNGEEDEAGGTKTIIARTEWGQMMDYLKAMPSVSMNDYMWKMTVPQISLGTIDTTRLEYPKTKNDKYGVISSGEKVKVLETPEDLLSVFSGRKI